MSCQSIIYRHVGGMSEHLLFLVWLPAEHVRRSSRRVSLVQGFDAGAVAAATNRLLVSKRLAPEDPRIHLRQCLIFTYIT